MLQTAFSNPKDIGASANIDNMQGGFYSGVGWLLDGTAVAGFLICFDMISGGTWKAQIAILFGSGTPNKIKSRTYNNGWTAWENL